MKQCPGSILSQWRKLLRLTTITYFVDHVNMRHWSHSGASGCPSWWSGCHGEFIESDIKTIIYIPVLKTLIMPTIQPKVFSAHRIKMMFSHDMQIPLVLTQSAMNKMCDLCFLFSRTWFVQSVSVHYFRVLFFLSHDLRSLELWPMKRFKCTSIKTFNKWQA